MLHTPLPINLSYIISFPAIIIVDIANEIKRLIQKEKKILHITNKKSTNKIPAMKCNSLSCFKFRSTSL